MENYRIFFFDTIFFFWNLKFSFNTCPPILWTWDSPANPKLPLLEAFICLVSSSIINKIINKYNWESPLTDLFSISLKNGRNSHPWYGPFSLTILQNQIPEVCCSAIGPYLCIWMLFQRYPFCRYFKCSLRTQAPWGCLIHSFVPNRINHTAVIPDGCQHPSLYTSREEMTVCNYA